jgi:hypothetical protein
MIHKLIRRVEIWETGWEDRLVLSCEQAITYEEMQKSMAEDAMAAHRLDSLLNGKGTIQIRYFVEIKDAENKDDA